jgi:PPOX class probable F420-dependent enzyme
VITDDQNRFLSEHRWALLATTRRSGAPQVSLLAYHWNGADIVFSVRSHTAKWANIGRNPEVVVTVTDDTRFLSVSGRAARVVTDPARHELTVRLRDSLLPNDYATLQGDIDAGLDVSHRVVIRVVATGVVGRI